MTFPIFRHQQSPQIRMPGKANPEQIEDFALKIIRARPNRSQRLNRRTRAVEPHFDPYPLLLGNRKQVVDNFNRGSAGYQSTQVTSERKLKAHSASSRRMAQASRRFDRST